MKRFIKICLIAGSVCVLIGGGISAVAAVLGGNLRDIVPQRVIEWEREISGVTLDGIWEGVNFDDIYVPEVFNLGEKGQEIFSSQEVKNLDIVIRTGNVVFVEDPKGNEVKIFCNRDQSCFILYEENGDLELQEYDGWKRKADGFYHDSIKLGQELRDFYAFDLYGDTYVVYSAEEVILSNLPK